MADVVFAGDTSLDSGSDHRENPRNVIRTRRLLGIEPPGGPATTQASSK
jgi:hypothetical protein